MTIVNGQIVATACVDKNGFELTEEGLQQYFEKMPERMFLNYCHDTSKPPYGEMFNPRLKRLDDGRLALVADIHYFNDEFLEKDHSFSIAFTNVTFLHHLRSRQPVDMVFSINPLYFNCTDATELFRLSCDEANIAVEHRIERGIDTPAIMIICATLSAIGGGFFGQMGADLYGTIKTKIKGYAETIRSQHKVDLVCHFIFEYDRLSNRPQFLVSVPSAMLDKLGESGFDLDSIESTLRKFCDIGKISSASLRLNDNNSPAWEINYIQNEKGDFQKPEDQQ